MIASMPGLLENCERPISLYDVGQFSSSELAVALSKLTFKSEGFSVADYLTLDGAYLVEYIDGRIQVLPMPSAFHQAIVLFIVKLLEEWVEANDADARVVFAPFFVQIRENQLRQPDVCLMLGKHRDRRSDTMWLGSDLVVEVVSDSNRNHDLVTKRREYALNGIPEYWIADPKARTLTVLVLDGDRYVEHGVFDGSQVATSRLLGSFRLDVQKMFAFAERRA